MKSKKFHKKLDFTKTTVADLNRKGLSRIYGGASEDPSCIVGTCTCVSFCLPKCPETLETVDQC